MLPSVRNEQLSGTSAKPNGTRENFEWWFQPVEGPAKGDVLQLSVPDTSHASWLSERLRRVIDRALHQQGQAHLDVICTVRTVTDGPTP